MRRKVSDWGIIAVVMLTVVALQVLLISQAEGAWIRGELSNFKVHNFTGDEVSDFELELRGTCLSCDDIIYWYEGPLALGWGHKCEDLNGGIIITWSGDHIGPCTWIHLGVRFRGCVSDEIVVTRATLTKDGAPVATVPFPWQTWTGSDECPVIDLIWPDVEFAVEITRIWAVLPEIIPLENLTQETVLEVLEKVPEDRRGELDPVRLAPGPDPLRLEIQTDLDRGDAAALVMYSVALPGEEPALWFISEAELSPEPPCEPCPVEPSSWGQIKALYR